MPLHEPNRQDRKLPKGQAQAAAEVGNPLLHLESFAGILGELRGIGVAICVCDETDTIRYVNTLFQTAFFSGLGDQPAEFSRCLVDAIRAGRGIKLVSTDPDDFARTVRHRRRNQAGALSFTTDTVDGKWWWVTDTKLANGWLVGIGQDVSALKQQEFQLRNAHASAIEEARTDFLTGLPNRRHGFRQAEALFAATRSVGGLLTIAVLDIDHFKSINDIYGHEVGDLALIHFGKIAASLVGAQDQLSRIGGEEFLLVSAVPDARYLEGLLSQICNTMPPLILERGREALRFTISAGTASASPEETWQGLLHRADLALYNAKANGRNRIEKADPAR